MTTAPRDPLAQLVRDLVVEYHSKPLSTWVDPRRTEGFSRRQLELDPWTPQEIAEHRAVAIEESAAYERDHPTGRPGPDKRRALRAVS